MKKWHTVKEATEYCGFSKNIIYSQIEDKRALGPFFQVHPKHKVLMVQWDYLYRYGKALRQIANLEYTV